MLPFDILIVIVPFHIISHMVMMMFLRGYMLKKFISVFIVLILVSGISVGFSGCKNKTTEHYDFSCDSIPDGNGEKLNVILLAGQSNAHGCAYTSILQSKLGSEEYEKYTSGFDVYINFVITGESYSNGFVKTSLSIPRSDGMFGPEIGMAEKLADADEKYCIVKVAYGGTNLHTQWNPASKDLYDIFIKFTNECTNHLSQKNYDVNIAALCWMQGESDASSGPAENYLQNTRAFVSAAREDLGDFAFIDAGISDSPYWVEYQTINNAKISFSEEAENNYYIDTIANGLTYTLEPTPESPDLAHYDSLAQIELGHLYAEIILSL